MQQALLRAKLPFGAKAAQPMQLDAYEFKHDKKDYNVYWDVRKGLIPIVGGARETGAARRRYTFRRLRVPCSRPCVHTVCLVMRVAYVQRTALHAGCALQCTHAVRVCTADVLWQKCWRCGRL